MKKKNLKLRPLKNLKIKNLTLPGIEPGVPGPKNLCQKIGMKEKCKNCDLVKNLNIKKLTTPGIERVTSGASDMCYLWLPSFFRLHHVWSHHVRQNFLVK